MVIATVSLYKGNPEKKRIKHAEVLVPDMLPLSKIEKILTQSQQQADNINVLIRQGGLDGLTLQAVPEPDLYF